LESERTSARRAIQAAIRFPWKLFFVLVVIAVFGSAGAVFGVVRWIGRDLPRTDKLTAVQPPVKTVV